MNNSPFEVTRGFVDTVSVVQVIRIEHMERTRLAVTQPCWGNSFIMMALYCSIPMLSLPGSRRARNIQIQIAQQTQGWNSTSRRQRKVRSAPQSPKYKDISPYPFPPKGMWGKLRKQRSVIKGPCPLARIDVPGVLSCEKDSALSTGRVRVPKFPAADGWRRGRCCLSGGNEIPCVAIHAY